MSALPSATPDPLPNAFSFLKGALEDVQAMPYPELSKLLKTYGIALESFNATTPTLIANPLAEVSGSQPQGPFQAPPPPPELDNNEANNPGGVRPMGAAAASAAAPQPWVPPANNAQNESSALLIRRALALQILKPFLAATQFALEKDHPFTWSPLDVKPPPRFFSEVVAFPWEGQLVFCGPYFSSGGPTTSRDPPTTVVKTLNLETLELRDVECSGQSPNPFRLFKRMPVHFVEGRHLYLLYSDQQVGTCVLTRLNLDTWAWEPLETTGTRPPSRDFVDGAFFMGRLYISQSRGPEATSRENAVYSLDLTSLVWQELRCTGAAPDCPNGSSLLYKGHLCVFSKDGDFLYQLSLATLEWHKFHLARRLPDFSARRHSHLFQLHEEDLIAARACDGYQLLSFNMETKAWRFVETLGRRPGRAKTEVTCVVHEGVLYCIGGQIDSHNHILSLLLGPRRPRKKQPVQPPPRHWVSTMRKSPFYDVAFVLDDGSCHTAHKSVLVARSEYFATMLQSGMKESTQAEIRLSNISGPTFGYVLDYIYEALDMGALPDEADFFDFFNAAMLFRIPELLDHIARHLLESIDAENALSLLALFHTASNDSLSPEYVRRVVSFIVEHGQEVAKQPSFVQMCKETPELAQVLFATLSKPLPVASSSSGSSASGSLKRKRSEGI